VDSRQAQVRWRGDRTSGKERVRQLKEGIGSVVEAPVEGVSEGTQGTEGLGRGVHGDPSCSRRSPMSSADADRRPSGLKDKLRQLPDFVIIGTQRGGTTSLYRYLTQHPDVGSAFRNEVHFLERYYDRGTEWYLAHFPLREESSVVGEASPNYLFHPDVPERARRMLPHARFIALLRNPVDRAYSHYQMKVRRGIEPLSFEEAIASESERLGSSDDHASSTWRDYSYIERGLYADQLERWMSVFPREQFLIIKSEDLYEDPERILHQTLAYLDLPQWTPANLKAYHLSEYTDMDPATRERLGEYFAPHNQSVYTLLGRDLGWEHE
jgi:hypothetical protein